MGWMEVLALLKRLGPTVSRLVPMLEMFVATRGESRGDTEAANRAATAFKDELAAAARNHVALVESLSVQAKQVEALRNDLVSIREADELCAARLLEVEMQVGAAGKTMQQVKQLLITVLVLTVLLLLGVVELLLRR